MWRLGFGQSEELEKGEDEENIERMMKLLQEHGWSFSYSRDPVLILIEYEEILENGELDE